MITEGIITEIDYTSNKCFIRIPALETVGDPNPFISEGRIAISPGMYNGYKINDAVWVGFVDEKVNKPLVIGKIYQGPSTENLNNGGHLNTSSLHIYGDDSEIPVTTRLTGASEEFESVNDLINKVKDIMIALNTQKNAITELTTEVRDSFAGIMNYALTDSNDQSLYDRTGEILIAKPSETDDTNLINQVEETK